MHVPAGSFADREQTLESGTLAQRIGANTAHGVMLRRHHRDRVLGRIDVEEVPADFPDLLQMAFDMRSTAQSDVEPQVLAEAGLHTLTVLDVLEHVTRDDVA